VAAEYQLTAGDSLEFDFSFPDYPASDGFVATVHLRCGSEKHAVTLTADGDNHVGTVLPAATADYLPGLYDMQVTVTDGTDRAVALESQLAVRPDPAAGTIAVTALEAELAAVNAAISAVLAGEGVASYTIQTQAGSRQIQRMSLEDLRDHRRYLEGKIDTERKDMGLKTKNSRWKRIATRFTP
jgi:hypothetical protein